MISVYTKVKITSIRFEDLVYRIINNDLTEDDKNILIEISKPKNTNITHRLKQQRNKANGEDTNIVQMKSIG